MKEFDIYLNERLTECDIIVYSIPYRDGLTAINRLILESCVENYTLTKFIAVQTGSELVSHIDEMLKICNERLNNGVKFSVMADFDTHYSIRPDEAGIVVSSDRVKLLATSFLEAKSALQIAVEPLDARLAKQLGRGHSEIELQSTVEEALKNSIERFSPSVILDAEVRKTNKHGFIQTEAGIPISSEVVNLCYRIYDTVRTALQINAAVLETEIHYSLGRGESGIELSADMRDGDYVTKYIAMRNAVNILATATESIRQFMEPNETPLVLDMDASCILKRYRLLGEMDNDELLSYDDMTLEDVDFVIL